MHARRDLPLWLAVCGMLATAALAVRALSVVQPLGIDQGLWASAAMALDRGLVLYRDVWDHKPPAIFLTYWLGGTTFGWQSAAFGWLDLAATILTTGCLYGITRRLTDRTVAATACALFTVLTLPAAIYGYGGILERAMSETFMALLVSGGVYAAVVWPDRPGVIAACLGLTIGTAALYKPTALVYLPAIAAWVIWRRVDGGQRPALHWRWVLVAGVATGIVPLLVVAWLWSQGALTAAIAAIIDFNQFYVQDGGGLGALALAFSKAIWFRQKTDALWCAGGIAAIVAVWDLARGRRPGPLVWLAVAWGGAAALAIALNGARVFSTYFIQALPPLAVLAAWWLVSGARGTTPRRLAAGVTVVLMLVLAGMRGDAGRVASFAARDWSQWTGTTPRVEYLEVFNGYANRKGYSARANAEVATYIAARTTSDDRIFLFGMNGVDLYVNTGRLPAQKFLRVNFYVPVNYPDPEFRIEPVVETLKATRPKFLVFERLHITTRLGIEVDALEQDPSVRELLTQYTLDTRIEDFVVYRRLD